MIWLVAADPEAAVNLFEDKNPAQLMGKGRVRDFPAEIRPGNHFRTQTERSADHEVYSVAGQMLYQTQSAEETLDIPTDRWNDGIYLVKVRQEKKERVFKTLVF